MGKKKHGKEGKVSFYEFFQRFPDEESAEKYFAEKRWGIDGLVYVELRVFPLKYEFVLQLCLSQTVCTMSETFLPQGGQYPTQQHYVPH